MEIEEFEGAEHVWAWNTDPDRFERVLGEHLRAVTAG